MNVDSTVDALLNLGVTADSPIVIPPSPEVRKPAAPLFDPFGTRPLMTLFFFSQPQLRRGLCATDPIVAWRMSSLGPTFPSSSLYLAG